MPMASFPVEVPSRAPCSLASTSRLLSQPQNAPPPAPSTAGITLKLPALHDENLKRRPSVNYDQIYLVMFFLARKNGGITEAVS